MANKKVFDHEIIGNNMQLSFAENEKKPDQNNLGTTVAFKSIYCEYNTLNFVRGWQDF